MGRENLLWLQVAMAWCANKLRGLLGLPVQTSLLWGPAIMNYHCGLVSFLQGSSYHGQNIHLKAIAALVVVENVWMKGLHILKRGKK